MEQRGCTKDSDEIAYAWAPELKRCPQTLMTPETREAIEWWNEWRRYGAYPFGTGSFDTEPAHVLDIIDVCQRSFDQAMSEVNHGG